MQAFEYANPTTLGEAFPLLGSRWDEARILAGGTDLLDLMKEYVETPKRVVNIKGIKDLSGIRKTADGLHIGALTTLDELMSNADVRANVPALIQAARGVSSMQMRNMGTVGGDLCQRPRCWYFRQGYGLLAMKDGKSLVPDGENRYHAIFDNQGPAYFVSASSFGPPLVALGARVTLASASGPREVPIEKFFAIPQTEAMRETAIRPNEILTAITVPIVGGRNATYEIRQKEALDWPLATASVVLRMRGGSVGTARIVLGHVSPVPHRSLTAEKLIVGAPGNLKVIDAVAQAAGDGATPLSMNAYKVQLARVAVKRALLATTTSES